MPLARALWITAPGSAALQSQTLAALAPGEVRVKTRYSAISRGTESLVFRGRVPPSQYRAMRAPFQEGEFPGPVKYGYCNVGQVVAGPASMVGHHVFCLYPHQTLYQVEAASVVLLPPALPPERAVLAANMETALNGVWDAAIRPGDRVAVVGAGVVGCLIAYLIQQLPGCELQLIDIDPQRQEVAEALGLPFATPATATGDCDGVVHVSGTPAGLTTALALAGFEATILELSWFGDALVPLPLGEDFHAKRLVLRSSQVGQVATAQRPRWSHRRRLALALRLLQEPRLDALISGESEFEALPALLAQLSSSPQGTLCHRIRYP